MLKPKYPGELMKRMEKGKSIHHRSHHKSHSKHHKEMPMEKFEGSPMDKSVDKAMMSHMHKHHAKKAMHHMEKAVHHMEKAHSGMHHKKMPHMKPKGAAGKAQVKKLGRTFKTGGFAKIEKAAAKEYGSKAAGKRVAGARFQTMARKHAGK
jgi:hypothetical protein